MATTPAALLKLPAELRNTIWQMTLTEDEPLAIRPMFSSHGRIQIQPIEPELLWACRQIRSEALLLYYACNRFTYSDFEPTTENSDRESSLFIWLHRLGKVKAAAVGGLILDYAHVLPEELRTLWWPDDANQPVCTPFEAVQTLAHHAAERLVRSLRLMDVPRSCIEVVGPDVPDPSLWNFTGWWKKAVLTRLDDVYEEDTSRSGTIK